MRILKFSADWCGPCKALSEWLKTIEHPFDIVEINIDGNREMIEQYGVRSVPTMIKLKDDGTTEAITGFDPKRVEKFLKV
jgi:thioredoxin-like negative regulator of GroEL